ncbi:MAG: hypothetical protein MZV65_41350 [Chromatiales bacterium]|nr:hypothetical protein [Chromatiales bacterium]
MYDQNGERRRSDQGTAASRSATWHAPSIMMNKPTDADDRPVAAVRDVILLARARCAWAMVDLSLSIMSAAGGTLIDQLPRSSSLKNVYMKASVIRSHLGRQVRVDDGSVTGISRSSPGLELLRREAEALDLLEVRRR